MSVLSIKNKHERDDRIVFEDDGHKYFVDGRPISVSVTGLIHGLFPKFKDNEMASNIINKKCSQQSVEKYKDMTSKEMILQKWREDGLAASALGTQLHRDIEMYFNGSGVTNDSVEYSYFQNFLKSPLMDDLVPYRTEWIIYDEELDLAGSIDMVFYNSKMNTYAIYDWKRCKKIEMCNKYKSNSKGYFPLDKVEHCNFSHYSLQLNFYKYILKKRYSIDVSDMCLLVLHPNNDNFVKYDVENCDADIEKIVQYRISNLLAYNDDTQYQTCI